MLRCAAVDLFRVLLCSPTARGTRGLLYFLHERGPEYESRFGAAELGPVPTGGLRFGAATGPHDGVHVTGLSYKPCSAPPPPNEQKQELWN